MSRTLYLDLDGVVTDFVRAAFKWYGLPEPRLMDIPWDFDKDMPMSRTAFWEGLSYNFWVGMPWTPEGSILVDAVEKEFGDRIALVTSPPHTEGSVQGKLDWVKENMPNYVRRTFVGARKELLASGNKILLDDRDKNVEEFRAHGGLAILVPRPWNARRKDCYPDGSFDVGDLMNEVKGLQ